MEMVQHKKSVSNQIVSSLLYQSVNMHHYDGRHNLFFLVYPPKVNKEVDKSK
jgi:hypothetical protein